MEELYFKKAIKPQIYAYTTPQYKNTEWVGEKRGNGLIKVGYTEKDVIERIWQQFPTQTPSKQPFEILLTDSAVDDNGKFFNDHLLHKKLIEKGFRKVNGEWFECTIKDLQNLLIEVKKGISITENRHQSFNLRPEQTEAVRITSEYFKKYSKKKENKPPHFLWNAKMRFGKTFTSYELARKMGWEKIIVLTYKPAVQSAWKEDIESHVNFEGWQFMDKSKDFESDIDIKKPLVWFASFQDILGRDKNGKVKKRYEKAKKIEWDCVIVDEYHFGAWRDSAKDFYTGETAKETEVDESIKAQEGFEEEAFPLKSDHFLYLSGTPFRAMANGEFSEDQIFNWTYADEQRAKKEWSDKDGENPYLELPQIIMMTYQLPEKVREDIQNTGQNEFSLNEFFKAKEVFENGRKKYVFEYENQVQQWLNIIRGANQIFGNIAGQHNVKPPIPFEDARLLSYLNHTFWFLPSVASCYAMEEMLHRQNNIFYHDYKIWVAAGSLAGIGLDAFYKAKDVIGNPLKSKTIILSCGKLTTGVTVPSWSGIFFLRDTTSPETYFQAAFRVQSPWVLKNVDGLDPNKKEVIKPFCYIFDFAPNRALNLIAEYSGRLDLNDSRKAEQRVQDFLNFLPVLCYDGASMQSLNATELLDIAVTGVASTMLAKRWQSAQLIDIGNITLERLLNSPEVLASLEKIEAFRNLNKDIKKVIANEKDIAKLKKEKADDDLSKKDEKELAEKDKENKGFKKQLREKLLKFITRIPVFMYLTDYREETLKDVITNIEPDLFRKVTGLTVDDFEKMCEIGVFNSSNINSAVFAFKRFEQYSLNYVGGKELKDSDIIGGFDAKIRRDELHDVIEGVV